MSAMKMSEKITNEMIDAGIRACKETPPLSDAILVQEIYRAMSAARQPVCGTCAEVIQPNALTGTTCECAHQPGAQEPFASALEETRVRGLREAFDAAYYALANPMASIPANEWGGRKDMMCPDEEDEGLDFNRSCWEADVIALCPLGVRPEGSIVLTASASAAIQQVLMELLEAATAAAPHAQAVDLLPVRRLVEKWMRIGSEDARFCAGELLDLIDSQTVGK